jgi:cytochrome c oxidase assembly protein subunit 15
MPVHDVCCPLPASASSVTAALSLARWLLVVAIMIVGIVVVGGITRLTESGVSITEWNVVSGTLPADPGAMAGRIRRYRQTPQYILVNGPAG